MKTQIIEELGQGDILLPAAAAPAMAAEPPAKPAEAPLPAPESPAPAAQPVPETVPATAEKRLETQLAPSVDAARLIN